MELYMKLSELLDRLEEDMDRDAMLAQTVKNPETNQDVTVKTALGYDQNHPARKAAAKIYAQFMAKKNVGQPAQTSQQTATQSKPTTPVMQRKNMSTVQSRPKNFNARGFRRQQSVNRMQQQNLNTFDSDDGYDAMRDRAAELNIWKRGRHDPYYDSQDYR
jgi:phenylalanyl-tRNA synthetase alpha subunit